MLLHAPAHHLAAVQVDHRRQVQPALIGGNVGDIASPHLVRCLGLEVARKQVRRYRQVMFAVGGDDKLSLTPVGNKPVSAEQMERDILKEATAYFAKEAL